MSSVHQLGSSYGSKYLTAVKDVSRPNHEDASRPDFLYRGKTRVDVVSDTVTDIEKMADAGIMIVADLIDTDFVPVIFSMVLDRYFCGFSKEELFLWATNMESFLKKVHVRLDVALSKP